MHTAERRLGEACRPAASTYGGSFSARKEYGILLVPFLIIFFVLGVVLEVFISFNKVILLSGRFLILV